ncbi:MAG: hypothetical protein S4CHLAM37_12060 [Chlamydiia bacterium]|nr:hypothetical protein [Chlamydiia bacterium]
MIAAHSFSLFQFVASPLNSLAFVFLILTTASFWIYKRIWLWGPLLLSACILAYFAGMLDYEIFIPILLLFCGYLVLKTQLHPVARLLVCLIIALLSLAFSFHLYPDIRNWLLADSIELSQDAPSFTYFWNFDKPFIGLFVLGLRLKLIENREDFKRVFLKTIIFTACLVAVFCAGSLLFDVVRFDFKLPLLTFAWLIGNLFFTVIPEEGFFRGFLQNEIKDAIDSRLSPFIAIFLVSLAFASAHVFFISNFSYLALAFAASFAYGLIYELTKSIESAIFAHYMLNVVHFIFFTYPILSSAV